MFVKWTDQSINSSRTSTKYWQPCVSSTQHRAWHRRSPLIRGPEYLLCTRHHPRSQGLGQEEDSSFLSLRLWQLVRWKQYMQITKMCNASWDQRGQSQVLWIIWYLCWAKNALNSSDDKKKKYSPVGRNNYIWRHVISEGSESLAHRYMGREQWETRLGD